MSNPTPIEVCGKIIHQTTKGYRLLADRWDGQLRSAREDFARCALACYDAKDREVDETPGQAGARVKILEIVVQLAHQAIAYGMVADEALELQDARPDVSLPAMTKAGELMETASALAGKL